MQLQLVAASLHNAFMLQAHSPALSQNVSLEPKLWTSVQRQTSSLRSELPMLASSQLLVKRAKGDLPVPKCTARPTSWWPAVRCTRVPCSCPHAGSSTAGCSEMHCLLLAMGHSLLQRCAASPSCGANSGWLHLRACYLIASPQALAPCSPMIGCDAGPLVGSSRAKALRRALPSQHASQ